MEPNEKWVLQDTADWFKSSVQPPSLNINVISFVPTSDTDKLQLEVPMLWKGYHLYTASFFCRKNANWFIYRVIYRMCKIVDEADIPQIINKLETSARTSVHIYRSSKNPLNNLKHILMDI